MAKLRKIEVHFPIPVDLPEAFESALAGLIDMVAGKYNKENPQRIMWTAGFGAKPVWSKQDARFLGKETDPNAPEEGEPTFDASVYVIECEEREDTNGSNPYNPEQEKKRKARLAEMEANHKIN